MIAPPPPPLAFQTMLQARLVEETPEPPRPSWCADVRKHREEFLNAALVIQNGDHQACYKFLFAQQSPYVAMFSPMEKVESYAAHGDQFPAESLDDLAICSWRHHYTVDHSAFLREHELGWVAGAEVFVIPDLVYTGRCDVNGCRPGSLALLFALGPQPASSRHGDARPCRSSAHGR